MNQLRRNRYWILVVPEVVVAQRGFEHLDVYHLAERLSDEVWSIVKTWRGVPRDTVGKQLVRAADGIGANIAEGSGRGTFADNARFIDMARGSLYETRHWLRRAFQRDLLDEGKVKELKAILDELGPRLNTYRSAIRRQNDPRSPKN